MTVTLRFDGVEYSLPADQNRPVVEDALAAARAGENGGWARFPVLRDGELTDLSIQVCTEHHHITIG